MASRNYSYQYETSPKKLRPEYDGNKSKKNQFKKKIATSKKKKTSMSKKKQEDIKRHKKEVSKAKFGIFIKSVLLFGILFLVLLRNSQISESFSKIQALKAEMTSIQKENDQLEISIQNSLNINNIEKEAKELLGMQKLTNKQTLYINLPKKDYVEHRAEEVTVKEEKNIFKNIISFFERLF